MSVALIEYRMLLNMVGSIGPTVPFSTKFSPDDCVYLADGTRHSIICVVIANDTTFITLDNGLIVDESMVFTPSEWAVYQDEQSQITIVNSLVKLQQLKDLLGI